MLLRVKAGYLLTAANGSVCGKGIAAGRAELSERRGAVSPRVVAYLHPPPDSADVPADCVGRVASNVRATE